MTLIVLAIVMSLGVVPVAGAQPSDSECGTSVLAGSKLNTASGNITSDVALRKRLGFLYQNHVEFRSYIDGLDRHYDLLKRSDFTMNLNLPMNDLFKLTQNSNQERESILVPQLRILSHLDPALPLPTLVTETFPIMLSALSHPFFSVEHKKELLQILTSMGSSLEKKGLTLNSYLAEPQSLDPLKDLIKKLNANNNFAIWL